MARTKPVARMAESLACRSTTGHRMAGDAAATRGGASMSDDAVERLRAEVTEPLKRRFVGRDEVVDLIALAVTAGEHLFLHGPPGTAKSALIRQFATTVRSRYFEYLLTRFSEPNEVFGPIDLVKLARGDGGDRDDRDAAGGRIRLPGRAVQRQQCDPQQPADGAQRADLSPGLGGPPAAVALAVRRLEPPARRRCARGIVRPLPAALPRG